MNLGTPKYAEILGLPEFSPIVKAIGVEKASAIIDMKASAVNEDEIEKFLLSNLVPPPET